MRDFIVKILLTFGLYRPIIKIINQIKFKQQVRKMRKNGLEMLSMADKAFNSMGVKAFLSFGTLLGAYRDKGFIAYDPDVDLGVLDANLPENMIEVMAKYGFQLHKQNHIPSTGKVIEDTYIYKGIHLDVFHYFEENDDFYTLVAQLHETKDWKEANDTDGFPCEKVSVIKTDFHRQPFMGIEVYMPIKTHEWLVDMYSETYMTPIKNWSEAEYKTRRTKSAERSYRKLYN
jgi:phosphorylcholine metabolism protein LicD